MNLLSKNSWLNFCLVFFGFYGVFNFLNGLLLDFKIDMAESVNVSLSYYWIIAFIIAFVVAMVLPILFCRPRVPISMGIGLWLGGILSMYGTLSLFIMNLDYYFRQEGLAALVYLLPHLTVVLGGLAAAIVGRFSNLSYNSGHAEAAASDEE